jgi:hypothetical protein
MEANRQKLDAQVEKLCRAADYSVADPPLSVQLDVIFDELACLRTEAELLMGALLKR